MSSGRVAEGPTAFSARQKTAWRLSLKPCRKQRRESDQIKSKSCRVTEVQIRGVVAAEHNPEGHLTCLMVALKAPRIAAAPPQSLFIPGIVVYKKKKQ